MNEDVDEKTIESNRKFFESIHKCKLSANEILEPVYKEIIGRIDSKGIYDRLAFYTLIELFAKENIETIKTKLRPHMRDVMIDYFQENIIADLTVVEKKGDEYKISGL